MTGLTCSGRNMFGEIVMNFTIVFGKLLLTVWNIEALKQIPLNMNFYHDTQF